MSLTFLIAGLIGLIAGASGGAGSLFALAFLTFVAVLAGALATGWTVLAAMAIGYGASFSLQISYLAGVALACGSAEFIRRYTAFARWAKRGLLSFPAALRHW
jgi:hypothetical protein